MDTLTIELLSNCLDMAKIVWRTGLQGTLILGDKLQKVFNILPKYFTHTDFDVHIVPSTQILKDMQQMQGLVIELIKSGIIEPDMAVRLVAMGFFLRFPWRWGYLFDYNPCYIVLGLNMIFSIFFKITFYSYR